MLSRLKGIETGNPFEPRNALGTLTDGFGYAFPFEGN